MKKKQNKMRNLYDQTADYYDNRYWPIQIKKYNEFLDVLTPEPLILDVGGGSGLLKRVINSPLVIFDVSIEMLRVGQEKYNSINLIAGDAESLPIRDRSFILITSFSMLPNLQNPLKGLLEMERVMTPNSKLVLTVLDKKISELGLKGLTEQTNLDIELRSPSIEDIGGILTVRHKPLNSDNQEKMS